MIRALMLVLLLLATPAWARSVAVIHAKAYTLVGAEPVQDATILIADGKIGSVVAHDPVPPGAEVVDAAGQIVTPGLVNGATQLGLNEVMGASDTDDRSVSSGPLGPAFDIQYALNPNSLQIPVARADGVTRALVFPSAAATAPFAGQGALLHLVPDAPILERAGAAMFATVGANTLKAAGGSRAAQWVLLRNALAEARNFAARSRVAGPRDQLLNRPNLVALQPVIAGTMPLALWANRESDIRQAIRLAVDMQIHVIVMGGTEAWRAADALAAAKIAVVLDPEADLPQTFDSLGARLDNAAILARAGVAIGFYTSGNGIYLSYDAGLDLREGAGIAVANGLPYIDALRAVTVGPARIWDFGHGVGTLTPGADADLVIWDGDPLEPTSATISVFVNGTQVPLRNRQTELRNRYAPVHANGPLPPAYR